jgi:hypothetical protein
MTAVAARSAKRNPDCVEGEGGRGGEENENVFGQIFRTTSQNMP